MDERLGMIARLVLNCIAGAFSISFGIIAAGACYFGIFSALIYSGFLIIIVPMTINFLYPYKSKTIFFLGIFIEFVTMIILCVIADLLRIKGWNDEFIYHFCIIYSGSEISLLEKESETEFAFGLVLGSLYGNILMHLINVIVYMSYIWEIIETKVKKYF